jgi:hypothetical protein
MKPTVRRLEEEFEGRVDFKPMNIDSPDSSEAKRKYKFVGQPQFVIVNGSGEIVASRNGFQQYETLKADIEAALVGKQGAGL